MTAGSTNGTSAGRRPESAARRQRPVRVLAVDDQEIFRRTARTLIAATPGFEQVGEAACGAEALALAAELHPDFVLVDVRMPGMDGVETARRLAEREPRALVVLTSVDELPAASGGPQEQRTPPYVRKQDLSTRRLRELWAAHAGRVRR